MESTWGLCRGRGLMQRTWGNEVVVYDPRSGNTHLLDPVATAVLQHLNVSDRSAAAIAECLLTEFEADSEEDVLAAVHAALAKLQEIGLVQSAEE